MFGPQAAQASTVTTLAPLPPPPSFLMLPKLGMLFPPTPPSPKEVLRDRDELMAAAGEDVNLDQGSFIPS